MKFLLMEKHSKEILDAAFLDLAVSIASLLPKIDSRERIECVFLVFGKEKSKFDKIIVEEESHRKPSTRLQN